MHLPPRPSAVPEPPETCSAFVTPANETPESEACSTPEEARAALASALGLEDGVKRDAALRSLESCTTFLPGLLRALRAELVPRVCADALVEPTLLNRSHRPRKDLEDALLGLSTAARLSRLVRQAPSFERPYDKQRFNAFFSERLVPWIRAEAQAIEELARFGSRLSGYGRGVAAIAAGLADMRFVEVVRAVRLPDELKRDDELSNTYYASLDQALEPRKARGRDAALAGLREFAVEGILHDARLSEAHTLLSTLYAGRRIDGLQGLLLPSAPPPAPASVEQTLAAELPTFYAGLLLAHVDATDPAFLAVLRGRGVPRAMRAQLEAAPLSEKAREIYARALLELGQRYWRAEDFRRSGEVARLGTGAVSDARRLIAAIAQAMSQGPRDAADMMLRGAFARSAPDVTALDELARSAGDVPAMAAYDAAYLLSLNPARDSAPQFFTELARRYRQAAKQLPDLAQRKLASENAKAAEQTARATR